MMEDGSAHRIWSALASPVRRSILDQLRGGPETTGAIAAAQPGLSRFAVMQHLGVLVEAGLVLPRREGRQRFNYLNPVPLRQAYERWVSRFAEQAAAETLALGRYVERGADMEQQAGKLVTVESEIRLKAAPDRVFAAFTTELDRWWAFRVKAESRIVFEAWPGGRIMEEWGGGAGVLYGNVALLDPPYKLVSRGGMDQTWTAVNTEEAIPDGDGTIYRKRLALWGDVPEETARMYSEGARAIVEQLLRRYVEEGLGREP